AAVAPVPMSSKPTITWPPAIAVCPGSLGPSVPAARAGRPWVIVSDGLAILAGAMLPLPLRTVDPPKVFPPSDDAGIRIRFGLNVVSAAAWAADGVSLLAQAT